MSILSNYLDYRDSFRILDTGVNLTDEEKSTLRFKLSLLEAKTPSQSKIKLELERNDEMIKGTLSVTGPSGKFISNHIDSQALRLYSNLEKEINKKILSWKKNRFINNIINIPQKNTFSSGGLK